MSAFLEVLISLERQPTSLPFHKFWRFKEAPQDANVLENVVKGHIDVASGSNSLGAMATVGLIQKYSYFWCHTEAYRNINLAAHRQMMWIEKEDAFEMYLFWHHLVSSSVWPCSFWIISIPLTSHKSRHLPISPAQQAERRFLYLQNQTLSYFQCCIVLPMFRDNFAARNVFLIYTTP